MSEEIFLRKRPHCDKCITVSPHVFKFVCLCRAFKSKTTKKKPKSWLSIKRNIIGIWKWNSFFSRFKICKIAWKGAFILFPRYFVLFSFVLFPEDSSILHISWVYFISTRFFNILYIVGLFLHLNKKTYIWFVTTCYNFNSQIPTTQQSPIIVLESLRYINSMNQHFMKWWSSVMI